MKKAINFDIDTKKYEEYTGRRSPTAYKEIRNFLNKNGFEHRQGSGYISKKSLNDSNITTLVANITITFEWLEYCIKEIDVTNVGRQHSLKDMFSKKTNKDNLADIEIKL